MKESEVEGKTVTLAVEQGLADMGLRRDQVEVQVLQEAAPGFLGIGSKPAKVRIREKIWGTPAEPPPAGPAEPREDPPKSSHAAPARHAPARAPARREDRPRPSHPAPDRRPARAAAPSRPHPSRTWATPGGPSPSPAQPTVPPPPVNPEQACSEVKPMLEEVLRLMGIGVSKLSVSWDEPQARVYAELQTPDSQLLIGKAGKPLESLQFLMTLMLGRKLKTPAAVQVDTEGYWKEREEEILLQVHQGMEMLNRTGKPVRLKPMDAAMRRLIHRTLAKHAEIETASEGEGAWRKVVLKPKKR